MVVTPEALLIALFSSVVLETVRTVSPVPGGGRGSQLHCEPVEEYPLTLIF